MNKNNFSSQALFPSYRIIRNTLPESFACQGKGLFYPNVLHEEKKTSLIAKVSLLSAYKTDAAGKNDRGHWFNWLSSNDLGEKVEQCGFTTVKDGLVQAQRMPGQYATAIVKGNSRQRKLSAAALSNPTSGRKQDFLNKGSLTDIFKLNILIQGGTL